MLETHLMVAIALLLTTLILTIISTRLGLSAPLFLVVAGLGLSLIPGIPRLRLEPDLFFLVLLPPLLYRAAWNTSWKAFWANRRPIGLHGIGLVIVTAGSIGLLAHWLIPNFSLPLGLLLGSVVAPPDALAATAVLERLRLPNRMVTILEGESLVNDATSLMLFHVAITAVVSGHFSARQAGTEFVETSLLGIGIGCGLAALMALVHRFISTSPNVDTLISVATPYLMYLIAERLGASGVLSVVSGGFVLSYHSPRILTSQARLQMSGVWETLVFMLNGLVFFLVGLQLPLLVDQLGGVSLSLAIGLGIVLGLGAMVIRVAWLFPTTYLPRCILPRLKLTDPAPNWRLILVMGWCGMRGIVTLASALTIPLTLADQTEFPFRALILFVAFVFILFTLLVQGLSMPFLIRTLGIGTAEREDGLAQELTTRLANRALLHIRHQYGEESVTLAPFIRQREKYERLALKTFAVQTEAGILSRDAAHSERYRQLKLDLIAIRRREISQLRRQNRFNEGLLRQKEWELDLEQAALSGPEGHSATAGFTGAATIDLNEKKASFSLPGPPQLRALFLRFHR